MSHQRLSGRRIAIALALVMVVSLLFVSKLVDVQIVRAAELQEQSQEIRTTNEVIWASRGSIVDSFGNDLAVDVDRYDISADPRVADDFRRGGEIVTLNAAINDIATITGAAAEEMLYAINKDREAHFTYLVKGVSPEQHESLKALGIPWLQMDLIRERTYPFGAVTSNLTGMLGTDEPLAGIELDYNECLAATNGVAVYQRGADGVRLPGTTEMVTQPVHGGEVKLTIDSDLQWYVLQQLAEHGSRLGAAYGSAVVVRAKDGHILAAADWPTFDANDFANSPTQYTEPGSLAPRMNLAPS